MKKYTVLLLRPDYITDNFGADVYGAYVVADDVDQAIIEAQLDVFRTDNNGEDPEPWQDLNDYLPLTVHEGHISSLI
jgi:hypothetical protein